jgi:ubiquitin-conjugating enzyme E2 D/E
VSLANDHQKRASTVPTVANQYTRNRKQHDTTAREWTTLYAKPKPSLSRVSVPTPKGPPSTSASTSATPPQYQSPPEAPREGGSRRGTAVMRSARIGSSTVGSPATTSVIEIDEGNEGAASSSTNVINGRGINTERKRKREAQRRSSAEVVDLIAEEEGGSGQSGPSSSAKRRRTSRNSNSHSNSGGDVIVIEDD